MSRFEKGGMPPRKTGGEVPPDIDDFSDNKTLYRLLSRLPEELRREHMARIEHLADDEAEGYLYALHERRDKALRESSVSDATITPYFEKHAAEIWKALETHVFTDANNHIGAGTTARIKRLDLSEIAKDKDEHMPTMAVKYLVTPTEKTLSVSGEHDLILELEQLEKIERAELLAHGENSRIRVPHPYFFYRKGKTQCYGMELIDGVNLEQGKNNSYAPSLRLELQEALRNVDKDSILRELDDFFDTMHVFCVHGDVKPRNLMISRDGHFYVIDFGQSLLANNVSEKSNEAFGEIKDMEKRQARDAVKFFLSALYKD